MTSVYELLPVCNVSDAYTVIITNLKLSRHRLDEKGYEATDQFGLALSSEMAQKWLEVLGWENCSKSARAILSNALPQTTQKPIKAHL